jgi:GGDEF domain-containing protein
VQRRDKGVALVLVELAAFAGVDEGTLREAARRLGSGLRKADTLARWGAAEFAIVLTDVRGEPECRLVIERLVQALDMDAAIGISLFPADAGDGEALMRNAHAARERARQLGRRHYRFYAR